ncbi:RHS repeat-associated core domain-containing protein, partial [Roseibacillus ishigakijimensis]|nr:RHS repeat-associated core domain-containing protein [Roseibacillus ishigakijimensis]
MDGLLQESKSYDNSSPANLIASVSYTYDLLGRVSSMTDSRVGTSTMGDYLDNGSLVSMTDSAGHTTSYQYDALGRRIKVDAPDTSSGGVTHDNITHTAYYPSGQVKAQWGDQTYPRWYDYDGQNRLKYLHTYTEAPTLDPDALPAVAPAGHSQTTTWTYDSQRGWLLKKRDAEDKGVDYSYTDGGRLLTRTWDRGVVTTYGYTDGQLTSVSYDNENNGYTTPDLDYTYDEFGRLETVERDGVLHAQYDYYSATQRVEEEHLNQDISLPRTLTRNYDEYHRPQSIQLGSDHKVGYDYDTGGRLNRVWHNPTLSSGVPQGSADFTYTYEDDSYSLIAEVAGPVHTVTNTWESDRNVLDTKANVKNAGSSLVSEYDYTVNAIGQRTGVTHSGSAFSGTPTLAWEYDALGQVIKADHSSVAQDRAYQYDAIGNRLASEISQTQISDPPQATTTTYTPDDLNQYTTVVQQGLSVSPVYDDDGNATAYPMPKSIGSLASLTWDAENRLISVQMPNGGARIDYDYDYLGRRIKRSEVSSGMTTSTYYTYDGWNCVAEYSQLFSNPPVLAKTYLWGLDVSGSLQGAGGVGGLLAQNGISGGSVSATHYPTYDGNGNVSEYLDETGAVSEHNEYDPFGNLTTGGTVSNFTYRFSTKPQDPATGLYYYGYRYYDPVTGRWPSRDPIEERGGENLYGFVYNDCNGWIDRLG